MAKLIREFVSGDTLNFITEDVQINGEKKKDYYLTGVYLEADCVNRNGRRYPKTILEREVSKFVENKIGRKNAYGELDHPDTPTVNMQKVSHIITSLIMDGNQGIGKAKILDTDMGRIIKACLDAGGIIGMSTRAVGSISNGIVQEDLQLLTVDAVADPSAPNAFVEGILESKNFIIGSDGTIIESAIEELQRSVNKKYDKFGSSDVALGYLMEFLNKIRKNI